MLAPGLRMVRGLAPPARSRAALAPHAVGRRGALVAGGLCFGGRGADRRASWLHARAPGEWMELVAPGDRRAAADGRHDRGGRRVAADAAGRAVRAVHRVHGRLDLRRVPGHRRAHHRAVGDVGVRGGPEGEDPRHQGRRRRSARRTTARSPTGSRCDAKLARHPGRGRRRWPTSRARSSSSTPPTRRAWASSCAASTRSARRRCWGSSDDAARARSPIWRTRSEIPAERLRPGAAAARDQDDGDDRRADPKTRPPARAQAERAKKPPPAQAAVLPGILLGEELFAHTSCASIVGSDVDMACPMCGVGPIGAHAEAAKSSAWRATSTRACTSSTRSWPTSRWRRPRSSWACPARSPASRCGPPPPTPRGAVADEHRARGSGPATRFARGKS